MSLFPEENLPFNSSKLTSRVEDLEGMLTTIHDYVEKVTNNDTQTANTVDRINPGK